MYQRPLFNVLAKRLAGSRLFIQVLAGPRQVGKTTLVRQVMGIFKGISHYATADEPALKDRTWVEQQWESLRGRLGQANGEGLLVLDEIQKIPGWAEAVKRLWDEDTAATRPIRVVVLGSSPLLVAQGITESLAGRFELLRVGHWSYQEMRDAFGWTLDQYLFFGGYPGGAALIHEPGRWAQYIVDSLIETSIARDILMLTRVDKPALLRRLFELGCAYSGQILSYQKMLGQLQDAGNTVTLAHYLQLLEGAGLIAGLHKFSGERVRQRASSPKLIALNTALLSAPTHRTLAEARANPESWGRLVETAIGASLAAGVAGKGIELAYWASGHAEVDFILRRGVKIVAFEVKSTRKETKLPGIAAFSRDYPTARKLLVGGQGIPLEEFLLAPTESWLA